MGITFWLGVVCTSMGLGGLLVAERADSQSGRWLWKPLASTGFVVSALGAGALDSAHGRFMLLAFALCFAGDVLLVGTSTRSFLSGVGSFAGGHLAFAWAFFTRGVATTASWWALGGLVLPAVLVYRWLKPHLEGPMRVAVPIYIVVICGMVALAVGTHVHRSGWMLLAGAFAFFVSDISVARDRFVSPGFDNRAWGLPLYYGAQLLLAASSGAHS